MVKRAIVLFALLMAVSCQQSSESKLIGKWSGKGEVTEAEVDAAIKQRGETGEGAAMMRQMMLNTTMDLELKMDKTYSMKIAALPMEGNWTLSGNKLELNPTKIAGMSIEDLQKQTGAPESSGKSMFFDVSSSFDELTSVPQSSDDTGTLKLRKTK